MSRYLELEKKWVRYKIKRLAIVFIPIVLLLFMGGAMAYYYDFSKQSKASRPAALQIVPNENQNIAAVSVEKPMEKVTQKPKCYTVTVDVLNIRKEPSLSSEKLGRLFGGEEFCSDINEENWIKIDEGWIYAKGTLSLVKDEQINEKQVYIQDLLQIQNSEPPQENQGAEIEIKTKSADKNQILKKMIESFNSSPDAKLAIDIGKRYYEDKKYREAQYWALRSNELDNGDASWILFAKAKFGAGEKDEAITILTTASQKTKNKEFDRLLNEMRANRE